MNEIIKKLNLHFYGSVIVLALLFGLVLTKQISFAADASVGIIAERYSIGLTLIAIPVALKLFADKVKKNNADILTSYTSASLLRLYIINVMTLANIVLYAMSHNMNFVWLTVVLFLVYLFCRPSLAELQGLAETPQQEEGEEEDDE